MIHNTEEDWLRENRSAIDAKISRGLAQLDSGEKTPGDLARARLQAAQGRLASRKQAFMSGYVLSAYSYLIVYRAKTPLEWQSEYSGTSLRSNLLEAA